MQPASVVIPTHNRPDGLRSLLRDLAAQAGLPGPLEVLVVDSPSGDDVGPVIDAARADGLDARRILTENVVAAKRNAGAAAARAATLLFLDDDMRVGPGWAAAHLDQQARHPDSWVSGAVVFPDAWTRSSNYYRYKNSRHLNQGPDREIPGKSVVSMNMSIPKARWEAAGGMSREFWGYAGEDIEFGYRVARSGGRLRYAGAALAEHHEVRLDIVQFARKVYKSSYESADIVVAKAPEAGRTVTTFRWTEPGCQRTLTDRVAHLGLRACARPAAVVALARRLRAGDRTPGRYAPFAYKALTLLVTEIAVADRVAGMPSRADELFGPSASRTW